MSDFSDIINLLSGSEFEETPVQIEEFIRSPAYLGLPPVSEYQLMMLKAMTQIYRKDTLLMLYGEVEGEKRWNQTYREVILQLGKGSGKDYTSTIACAYIVYQLLCLKDPASYYGKPPGDAIDIINIAINAQQAKNVFFKGLKQRIRNSPWFEGRWSDTADAIRFDKEITVHSGHSEREAFEGYNVLVVILDEIAGFAIENTTGHQQAKTAQEIYLMYAGSLTSRFPDYGKLLLLSFPRFKGDFIQQRYDACIAEKETIIRSETLAINGELPVTMEGNSVTIEWEEDHIISYREPRVFALKRPTWEVNPGRKIEDIVPAYMADPIDTLSRFACMPPEAVDAFFKSRAKVELAFENPRLGVDEMGNFDKEFKPDPDKKYFIHVDLAQKVDRCAVSLAHVEKWVDVQVFQNRVDRWQPFVVVDAIRYWTPTSSKNIDFADVRDYILSLYRMGFKIDLVTFDRWNSTALIDELATYGIKTDILSVAKTHYITMQYTLMEERLKGPKNDILIDELLQLRVIKDKVDHPRSGGKDLSDATCGAIFNAIQHTPKRGVHQLEVHTYDPTAREDDRKIEPKRPGRVISAPPQNIQAFLDGLDVI